MLSPSSKSEATFLALQTPALSLYLPRLTARLADGLCAPAGRPTRPARPLPVRAQNPDGGFSGREGGSDLYYTGFALRGLAVLDALSPAVVRAGGGVPARQPGAAGQRR